jgi:type III restriction enzyme
VGEPQTVTGGLSGAGKAALDAMNPLCTVGYLTNMLRDTKRSIYEHVVYDSATERDFADALEKDDDVVLYAKLPGWFKVPTPLGTYNPDWAVLVNKDGTRRLYFVVETKSSLFTDDLRNKESAKIECGKAHFKALAVGDNPARYLVARSLSDVMSATGGLSE